MNIINYVEYRNANLRAGAAPARSMSANDLADLLVCNALQDGGAMQIPFGGWRGAAPAAGAAAPPQRAAHGCDPRRSPPAPVHLQYNALDLARSTARVGDKRSMTHALYVRADCPSSGWFESAAPPPLLRYQSAPACTGWDGAQTQPPRRLPPADTGKWFACKKCKVASFARTDELTAHMNACMLPFACGCEQRFQTRAQLLRHCQRAGHEPASPAMRPVPTERDLVARCATTAPAAGGSETGSASVSSCVSSEVRTGLAVASTFGSPRSDTAPMMIRAEEPRGGGELEAAAATAAAAAAYADGYASSQFAYGDSFELSDILQLLAGEAEAGR
jgi:hypothetical protein